MIIGCCWPLWGNTGKPTHEYCGKERKPGRVYCPRHCARAYVPRRPPGADPAPEYRRSADTKRERA